MSVIDCQRTCNIELDKVFFIFAWCIDRWQFGIFLCTTSSCRSPCTTKHCSQCCNSELDRSVSPSNNLLWTTHDMRTDLPAGDSVHCDHTDGIDCDSELCWAYEAKMLSMDSVVNLKAAILSSTSSFAVDLTLILSGFNRRFCYNFIECVSTVEISISNVCRRTAIRLSIKSSFSAFSCSTSN